MTPFFVAFLKNKDDAPARACHNRCCGARAVSSDIRTNSAHLQPPGAGSPRKPLDDDATRPRHAPVPSKLGR